MNEVIAIDLGSNSFRVIKYDCVNNSIIDEYHQVVGLADGLINTGVISQEALNRVIDALKKASQKLQFHPKDAVCVTTAAVRKAKNQKEVLNFILKNSGADFKVIDSYEEARLTLLAIKYALKRENISRDKFMVLDIGGGSTELTISNKNEFFSRSFDFGIVTMTQKHLKNPNIKQDLENRKEEIKSFLKEIEIDLKEFKFVATAGTPTTIAAIKKGMNYFDYDKNQINGTIVNLQDLKNSLNLFQTTSSKDLIKIAGKGRIEYLKTGIYIYNIFFEALNKQESIVLDDGLREGVAINFTLQNKIN